MMKKILTVLLILGMIVPVGCSVPQRHTEAELADDYIYMWHPEGVREGNYEMRILSAGYSLTVDTEKGKLSAVKNGIAGFESGFDGMDELTSAFSVNIGGEEYKAEDAVRLCDIDETSESSELYSRVLESGRYMQRMDVLCISLGGTSEITGRLEVAAKRSSFTITYDIYAKEAVRDVYLMYELILPDVYNCVKSDGTSVTMVNKNGVGYAFRSDSDGGCYTDGNKLIFYRNCSRVNAFEFTGVSFTVYPITDGAENPLDAVEAAENVIISATQTSPNNREQTVSYNRREGYYNISLDGGYGVLNPFYSASGFTDELRAAMERVDLTLTNPGNEPVRVVLRFEKDSNSSTPDFSVFGFVPMLRDSNGEALGIPVQISKSWNSRSTDRTRFDYSPANSMLRTWEGVWYHGWSEIELQPNETKKIEYTCAYENWGGVNPASHSQLCITGWGGNQLWEETSLVPWTETFCYDPDQSLSSSFIGDVRSLYNNATNAGGAEFLVYYNRDGERVYYRNMIARYNSQGPNLTDTVYRGITSDGNIQVTYRVNMGRTDDIGRVYYTITYEFLKDTDFNRMTFFQMHADNYGDNNFTRNAYGNINGVISDKDYVYSVDIYEGGEPQRFPTQDTDQWFFLYKNADDLKETGNVYAVVREYSACINGKNYATPNFNERQTSHGRKQLAYELTVPSGVDIIKAGSKIELVIEFGTMADFAQDYFGTCSYILESDNFGTAAQALQQAQAGKQAVTVSKGKLNATYPIEIAVEGTTDTVAEFELKGGLGYVPLRFTGLPSYSGYRLQVKTKNGWQNVNQEVYGNDYWQCDYDFASGSYSLCFNVDNGYNAQNGYRLVKIK